MLSKNHIWFTENPPFRGIISYKANKRDGIKVYSNHEVDGKKQKNDLFTNIFPLKLGQIHGISLGYFNEMLSDITYYKNGKQDGINISFDKGYPSLLVVYENNKNMGLVDFRYYGRIRGIKFGSHYKDETREDGKDNDTYNNNQKAFKYLEENGIKYWVVYNPKGQILIKYPVDNDFCKAEFYENGKKVEIPYYFDQQEFEEVYEKIKQDANRS